MRSAFQSAVLTAGGIFCGLLAFPVGASVTVPASTVKYTFDFANTNTSITTSGPSSKDFGYSKARVVDANGNELSGGSTPYIGVTTSAWNITKNTANSNYTVAQSTIGQYVGGLGITAATPYDDLSGNCANGGCGTHQIDSQGASLGSVSTDVLQLVFSQAVTLGAVTRNAYGLVTTQIGNYNVYSYDDDMSWGKGSGSGLSTTTAMNQSAFDALWNGIGSGYDNGACASGTGTATGAYCAGTDTTNTQASASNSSYASKVWYISAGAALSSVTSQDTIADAFKLTGVTVYSYSPQVTYVPEPATWAMMVIGFGVTGSAMRRRRAAERAATALA